MNNKAVNHRNMRILLILILSIFSFVFCLKPVMFESTHADNPGLPMVSVESKTVHRGQTFTIDVNLTNNVGLISLFLTLDYDNTVMKLTDVVQGDALSSLTMTTTNPDTEDGYGIMPFNILWDGRTQDFTNGTIITFVFDSYMEAPIGDYPVKVTFDKQNTNTQYKTPIDVDISNGVVTLITGEYQAVYRDYDGTVLFEKDYNADDIPSYPYEDPFREENAEYVYEFIGWKGVPSPDLNTLIYEANYRLTPQVYTVFYYVDGINGYPDGVIDDSDFFMALDIDFGSYIELPTTPLKQYYEFYGWYEDENFTTASTYALMPSKNIRLYGFYKFDVREDNIPIISLQDVDIDKSNNVEISAKILKNTGFNGMILTLNYDREALIFEGFEQTDILTKMQFDTTNTEDLSIENFKFYYEAAENNYETGEFLKLHFKVKEGIEEGTYRVWFDYDYHTDATYVTPDKEIKYSMLEFYNGEVPVGLKYHWNNNISTERGVDITSDDGKPINVYLEVDLVTDNVQIDESLIQTKVGDNMYLSSAYNIRLIQNRKEIQPNTTLIIKIKLTEKEQKSNIKFYYLNDNFELVSYDFKVENGELIFTTNHLSHWVIFSDYNEGGYISPDAIFGARTRAVIMIGAPLLLAIATMVYALRLREKINKMKKEAQND